MLTLLAAATAHIPIPPPQPLPADALARAEQLQHEAWHAARELDALMNRLEVLDRIARQSHIYDAPAGQLWLRCYRISKAASRRWKRRRAATEVLRKKGASA